jgi:hypothetical protein|tara:strand:+ start:94 stop:288 length:195 start_codon:yes stop_codon:yes gene_type:complete
MSVKPGQTSKKTLSAANGLGLGSTVGSETMNPPSPLPHGWQMDSTNYSNAGYTDTSADSNGSHL